jgi:hypothetical protein
VRVRMVAVAAAPAAMSSIQSRRVMVISCAPDQTAYHGFV